MNWIKQNKKLAGILGVMLAGAAGLGTWLYFAWSSYADTKEQWDDMSGKVTKLQKSADYPSPENVVQAGKKLEEYRGKFTLLRKVLLSPGLQEEVKPVSETEFQANVKEHSKVVREKAVAAGLKDFPKEFALGFDEYTATLPPSAEVAAELNVHLDAMVNFVTTLVTSRIKSLDSLERTKLPEEKGGAPKPAPPPPPRNNQRRGKAPPPVASAPGPVLDRYTIKCVFTTDEVPLENVLNKLSNPAETRDFLAVRLVRVENEKSDAPTKEEIRQHISSMKNSGGGDGASFQAPPGGKAAPKPNVIEPPAPAKEDATAIMGQEMLKVYMEVDYIRFRKPAEDPAAGPQKN